MNGQTVSLQHNTPHFGEKKRIQFPGITVSLVDTENSQNRIGWHYHENPHLTFVVQGRLIEGTRRHIHDCMAGTLLFHAGFEPHYNVKSEGNAKCIHLGFTQASLDELSQNENAPLGIFDITDPGIKCFCYKLFREALLADDVSEASIECLSWNILGQVMFADQSARGRRPRWVSRLEDLLRTEYAKKPQLAQLSRELDLHPVYLSRSFSRYFNCTLGEYVRRLRIARSLSLMSRKDVSLTDIAFRCGFADQSHFLRSFKQIMGFSPSAYRKLVLNLG